MTIALHTSWEIIPATSRDTRIVLRVSLLMQHICNLRNDNNERTTEVLASPHNVQPFEYKLGQPTS